MAFAFSALAQQTDTIQSIPSNPRKPRVERDWKPSFVLVGADVGRMVINPLSEVQNYEGFVSLDFDRYLFNAEFGHSTFHRDDEFLYEGSGTYYRIGLAKNFAVASKDRSIFTMGLNYARSNFDQTLIFEDSFFGEQSEFTFQDNNAAARWWELTGGIHVNLWENLNMGYVVRLKFLKKTFGDENVEPWDVPGYGRNKKNGTELKNATVGLNYYLSWRFDLREKALSVPRS